MRRLSRLTAAAHLPPPLPPCSHTPTPYTGPSLADTMALRRAHLAPSCFHYYDQPLQLVEGRGCWVFDESGRRYLDAFGGIVTTLLGHGHPGFAAAVARQASTLAHTTTIYAHPGVAAYAAQLAATLPAPLSCVFLVNSGSEATDLALQLVRGATGATDVLALRGCYHGTGMGAGSLVGLATWRQPGASSFGVHHVAAPDAYRGAHGADGAAYAADVVETIAASTAGGRVAGFFAESVQGVGGVVPLAPGYLAAAYALVRAAGGLCVADEVQSGFGRTGDHFWGFQRHGVVPDVVTMAKGVGNGFPLAAVATTPAVAAALTRALWLNTFGGSPVACAAGGAVLAALRDEGLQANAAAVGGRLLARLRALAARHDLVGDVRGHGLLLGVELVQDRATRAPAGEAARRVHERARAAGLLVGRGGRAGCVLRLALPLCVTPDQADFAADVLDHCLSLEG